MIEIVRLWLHLLGAAIWVGSQVFVLVVMVPALRTLDDRSARLRFLRAFTGRFGWLGGAALAVQVATGFWLLSSVQFETHDFRYGYVLDIKLTMVTLTIILTAIHTFVLGPRMLAIYNAGGPSGAEDEARLRKLRAWSGIISAINLLLAIAILAAASTLTSTWAHQPV